MLIPNPIDLTVWAPCNQAAKVKSDLSTVRFTHKSFTVKKQAYTVFKMR